MITEQQRQLRRNYIGSSDVAGILGMDQYSSPLSVYMSKVCTPEEMKEESDKIDALLSVRLGNHLEPLLIDMAGERYGLQFDKSVHICDDQNHMMANYDGLTQDRRYAVECKVNAVVNAAASAYGEEGTIEELTDCEGVIPVRLYWQCQHQMAVCNHIEKVYASIMCGGKGHLMYTIVRNDMDIGHLQQTCKMFWERHVIPRLPPDPTTKDYDYVLKSVKRTTKKTITIPDEEFVELANIDASYQAAKDSFEELQDRRKAVMARVIAGMGESSIGVSSFGSIKISSYSTTRIDTERLKVERPDFYAKFSKTSTVNRVSLKCSICVTGDGNARAGAAT